MIDYAHEIKQSVSVIDACERYGITLDRAGFGRCPFHNERTASFKAYDGTRGYCCFGCHKQGDVIDFAMRYFDLSFKDALEKLNTDFNLNLPIGQRLTAKQKRNAELAAANRRFERAQREKRYKAAMDEYNDALTEFCELDKVLIAEQETAARTREVRPYLALLLKERTRLKYKLDVADDRLTKIEIELGVIHIVR